MSPIKPIWKFAHSSIVPISVIQTLSNTTSFLADGVDECYIVPDDNALDFSGTFTANIWTKGTAGVNDTFFVKRDTIASVLQWSWSIRKDETTGARPEVLVFADAPPTIFKIVRGVSFPNTYEAVPSWHMITLRWDNTLGENDRLALFVDGVIESDAGRFTQNDNMSTLVSTPSAVTIGATLSSGAPIFAFDGNIDEPILWNAALSDAVIAAIFATYTSGVAFDPNTNGGIYASSANVVAFWRMGDDPADDETIINDQTSTHDGVGTNVESGDLVADAPP